MGWTWSHENPYKSNKEIIQEMHKSTSSPEDEYCQRGTTVYGLLKYKDQFFVCCWLCERDSRDYYNFGYKDIDAVYNLCFDFPKKWLSKLSEEYVKDYRKARTEYEAKQKEKAKNFPKSFKEVVGKSVTIEYAVDTNFGKKGDVYTGTMKDYGVYMTDGFRRWNIPTRRIRKICAYVRVNE